MHRSITSTCFTVCQSLTLSFPFSLAIPTVALALIFALPSASHADFTYTTNNLAITITGHSNPVGHLDIPDTIEGYPVTSIGDRAFQLGSSLTSVTIPASVTTIGADVFFGHYRLTNITVSVDNPNYSSQDGVLFNGDKTILVQCPGGKSGSYAIPAGVTSIGEFAFIDCSSLTSVTIPVSVASIGEGAFAYTRLTRITIPNSVTNIGSHTFCCCFSLTSVTLPDSVTSIGEWAFSMCTGLTSVIIPASVTSIGDGAFHGCKNLSSVTIPDSVTSIGSQAFLECASLTSVTIPASLTSIGSSAFSGCSKLTNITASIDNPNYSSQDGVLFSKDKRVLVQCPGGISGNYTIPASVTNIGSHAFLDCRSLTSVTIPDSVTSIGALAFSGCSSLTSITIPDSVTSIGRRAFRGCTGLSSVTIPDSVTSIGDEAFFIWRGLTNISVSADNPNYSSQNGVLFNRDKSVLVQCPSGKSGNYAIPTSVTTIGDRAFASCRSLTSVAIPYSVTSIRDEAFVNCTSLTSVIFAGSAPTSIGNFVFLSSTPTIYRRQGTAGWGDTFSGRPVITVPDTDTPDATNNP